MSMGQHSAMKKPVAKGKVIVRTPNVPGSMSTVDGDKYYALKQTILTMLPNQSPGLGAIEMHDALLQHLPEELFPGGAKTMQWLKCVQLDLEAQNVLVREITKPLRWHQQYVQVKGETL